MGSKNENHSSFQSCIFQSNVIRPQAVVLGGGGKVVAVPPFQARRDTQNKQSSKKL